MVFWSKLQVCAFCLRCVMCPEEAPVNSYIFEELFLPERILLNDVDAATPAEVDALNLKKCCAMVKGFL